VLSEPSSVPGPRGARFATEDGKQRYRIEVGRVHGVEPRHIVGAITNEAQLSSGDIGAIKLFHDFSLVDLPARMTKETQGLLQGIWICGQPLNLSVDGGPGAGGGKKFPKKREFGKGSKFKPGGKKPPRDRKS
jgi:ATP-dependent RNA helicase DeaD